jgi:hypothetical protein
MINDSVYLKSIHATLNGLKYCTGKSKMLPKLIEGVVRDYQFYITATSICIFTFLNINGVMQNHIVHFSLKG